MATSRGRGAKLQSSLLKRPGHTRMFVRQLAAPNSALKAVMTDFTFTSNPTTAVLKTWNGTAWIVI